MPDYAANLRRELCFRNADFAQRHQLTHVPSFGREPTIVYEPKDKLHGNFYPASYRAIQKNPAWRLRLDKVHTQAKTSLPRADRRWRELDSCVSSDALLMNIFCCPRILRSRNCAAMLGVDPAARPQFGYRPRVPLSNGHIDRTEVDLKLGGLLVEAKLTESDFQVQSAALVENYRDFNYVFSVTDLPRMNEKYVSYQLIRNVLAAHAANQSFCLMADDRRPDLIERWHAILRCVQPIDLRTRCKVLTWQELSPELPASLQVFLARKYGIGASSPELGLAD
jgi:hypothetical protein